MTVTDREKRERKDEVKELRQACVLKEKKRGRDEGDEMAVLYRPWRGAFWT